MQKRFTSLRHGDAHEHIFSSETRGYASIVASPALSCIYDFEGKKNISGERIREARLKLRLSQSDLAARVQVEGVTMERDSISRIEIGTRFIPDYEIPVFARVLGVSALWLLGIE